MSSPIGMNPGTVYTQTDQVRGKCPATGTYYTDPVTGKAYRLCIVTATANMTNGNVVTIDGNSGMAQLAAGPPAETAAAMLGVLQATVTCTLSMLGWVQVYGPCSVLASASCLPNVILGPSATAGQVDDALTTLSAYIDGILLTATTGVTGLTAAILNYPRFATEGV